MKKVLLYGLILFFLASCSGGKKEADIKDQIRAYKEEISTTQAKIRELEEQLSKDATVVDHSFIPVRLQEIQPIEFEHFIEVSGTVEAANDAFVSPEINGQIKKILVNEGAIVSKGQVLAVLNTNLIEQSMAELRKRMEMADTIFSKQKSLWEMKIGSEVQYLQAKNNKESLEKTMKTLEAQRELAIVKAPFSGIVDEIFQKEGEMSTPGIRLMQLVNLSELYINSDVSEAYLSSVHKGEMVEVNFPSYPDLTLDIPVHRVGNVINPQNRTFVVQLKMQNISDKIKPNLIAKVRINDFRTDSAMVIPSLIIRDDMKGRFIYIEEMKDGVTTAKKTYISTGISYSDKTMVTGGLLVGQKVITDGFNLVTEGSKIRVVK
ncbi:MAG: efflux RND transporter periplasmic adaptor subunit [Bacteroidetes bacterium]|nr:efflux RND transporter periplasmic adaptor subunit [Bacteroidota bacterium]MBU1719333.1 efflux RND transporter periplasmic adaptor subunit [Bacteroidota bacterium]